MIFSSSHAETSRRRSLTVGLIAFLVLSALGTSLSSAQDRDSFELPETEPLEFVLGNVEFVLLHELAHMLIRDKQVPMLGPEEYAADYIATAQLIQAGEDDLESRTVLQNFVYSAAEALSIAWNVGVEYEVEIPYWGLHALTIQRYYSIICLLYGSNEEVFGTLADAANLPEGRAEGCSAEYEQMAAALEWLNATYGRSQDDPLSEEVSITYDEPRTRMDQTLLGVIQDSSLIEQTVAAYRQGFQIDDSFRVIVGYCGQPQGAWVPDRRELIICYELINEFMLLERMRDIDPGE